MEAYTHVGQLVEAQQVGMTVWTLSSQYRTVQTTGTKVRLAATNACTITCAKDTHPYMCKTIGKATHC